MWKKDKILQVRINEKELEEIKTMADEHRMNVSEFLRFCILFYSINKNGINKNKLEIT